MSDELRDQIRNSMELKETDELLDIWQTNDRNEWSDTAFDVVRETLKNRGVDIPAQNEPVFETDDDELSEEDEVNWEDKILDDENQPELYDPLDVLSVIDYLNLAAKIFIVVTLITALEPVLFVYSGNDVIPYLIYYIPKTLVEIAVVFFSIRALTHILRILMEMEFNSRKGIWSNRTQER